MNEAILTEKTKDRYNHDGCLIVYIEYQDGLPHDVTTCSLDGKGLHHWDFEEEINWGEFMFYSPGSGGNIKELQGPHYASENSGASYWVADIADFRPEYPPINCTRLESPIPLKVNGSEEMTYDPFKFAYQQVEEIRYCRFCGGHLHEYCNKHSIEDITFDFNDEDEDVSAEEQAFYGLYAGLRMFMESLPKEQRGHAYRANERRLEELKDQAPDHYKEAEAKYNEIYKV